MLILETQVQWYRGFLISGCQASKSLIHLSGHTLITGHKISGQKML